MALQQNGGELKRDCLRAFAWQLFPCIGFITSIFTWGIRHALPWVIVTLAITAAIAATVHRSRRVGIIAFVLPIVAFVIVFLLFVVITFVPSGQHP